MILADTSIWIDYARRGPAGSAAALGGLLDRGELATCGPVAAEILAGTPQHTSEQIWNTLASLPWVELDTHDWHQVGLLAARLHAAGSSVALTDLAIAVASARAGHSLWTLDRDFERIAALHADLRLYDTPPA